MIPLNRNTRIDLLMAETSQYHVIHHFTRKLYEALVRAGMICRLLEGNDRLVIPAISRPDLIMTFNGMIRDGSGSYFCDYIKVPALTCLLDPPYRFPDLIKSPYISIACDDRLGCEMLRSLGFHRTLFIPHAVEPELCPDPAVDRIYDVAFLATCIDFEARRQQWGENYPANVSKVMEDAAETALSDDSTSFISVMMEKIDPWENQRAYEDVELYIKGRNRVELVKAIKGNQVHVFGNSIDVRGWKDFLDGQSNVVVHPSVEYTQALEIMKQSKVVLNSSIKNKQGAHERIFAASACGAAVATNDNPYMQEYFTHGTDMLLFKCGCLEQLNDEVHDLLGETAKRESMAAAGREIVMKHHTWDCRVKDLISAP